MTDGTDLVMKFTEHYGMHLISGAERPTDIGPLLPFLLLDAGWMDVSREIERMPCRQKLEFHRRRLAEAYGSCMGWLFRPFTEDETDMIIELMDEMEAMISRDHDVTRFTVMRALSRDFNAEQQKVAAAAIMLNTMAWMAETVTDKTYKGCAMGGFKRDLALLRHHCEKFGAEYMRQQRIENNNLTEAEVKEIDTAAFILETRIIKWLKETRNEQTETSDAD